jgi:cell pole-organizing protein PopZ
MATPAAQQEPTMEEILASIRRIISEDASQAQPAAQPEPEPASTFAPATAPAPVAPPEPEVLELTNVVLEELPPEPEPEPEPEPIPEPPRRRPQPEPVPEPRLARRAPAPEPRYTRNQPDLDMVDKDDGILSSQASSAITNAFGMLSRERDVSVSGASLEEIVTQIMKPLLAQWLDEHLPEIVERVVQQEIERAARSTGRRR